MFNKEDISFLFFEENFDTNFINDSSKFIFAPNGTGKTTIYNEIKKNRNEYAYIDYSDLKNSIIAQKKKLVIGSSIKEIENKQNEKNQIIGNMDIKNNLKISGITKKEHASEISTGFSEIYNNYEAMISNFNNTNVENINNLLEKKRDFLIKNFNELMNEINYEEELNKLKEQYKKEMLSKVDLFLEDNDLQCPICNSIKDVPVKEIIREKLSEIDVIQNNLITNYKNQNNNLSSENVIEEISELKQFVTNHDIKIEEIINCLICGNSVEKANQIIEAKNQIAIINNELIQLEMQRNEFYNNLVRIQDQIQNLFVKKFDVELDKIDFNDAEKCINITLRRNVDTYSTGEINLLVFMIKIYEFIASDKSILVIDDPLTSYDIINQYKIIYELINSLSDDKKALVFTHNINAINIANTQYRNSFEVQYIEKCDNVLYLKNCNIEESDSFLNIQNLLNFLNDDDIRKSYINLLIDKDNLDDTNNLHKIFHYDSNFSIDYNGEELNNNYFVDLIDNFDNTSIENNSFEVNTINKIIYLTAIRVWIEKQFFDIHGNDNQLMGKTLGKKIDYLFPRGGDIIWSGSPQVTRTFLMSKKVMINQNEHYKSQILPFYYATNLSIQDISEEIIEIKDKFNQ